MPTCLRLVIQSERWREMGREYSNVRASGNDKGDGGGGGDADDAEDREGEASSGGAWINRLIVLRIKGAAMATTPK